MDVHLIHWIIFDKKGEYCEIIEISKSELDFEVVDGNILKLVDGKFVLDQELEVSRKESLRERLNRAQILLDKTGRLTRIRNGVEELTNPFYTIDYVPPVEEEIKRKMTK